MSSPLGCPYSEDELDRWDSVANPMGNFCYECEEWECEHNANGDNPNFPDEWEYDKAGYPIQPK